MKHIKIQRKKQRGATMVEVVTGAAITTLVLFGSTAAMISGMNSWARGQGKIDADSQSQKAVRVISMELRQAMTVTVDSNGLGLTYRLPSKDANGDYIIPVVWDNIYRRIEYSNGVIKILTGENNHVICRNVILTDPFSTGGVASYKIFTAGSGAITRQLVVMIATRTNGARTENVTGRVRESIYLRNIPSLTQ